MDDVATYGSGPHNETTTSAQQERQEQVHRLSRLAGQIGGIARMIDENRTTSDILTQIKAVRSALNAVEERVIQNSLRQGIERALELSDRQAMREELGRLFGLRTEANRTQRIQPDVSSETI